MPDAERDAPTMNMVAEIRRRFPTEAEHDRMLTRKMERRTSGPHRAVELADIERQLRAMLEAQGHRDIRIDNLHWFSGGASKIQVGLTLDHREPDGSRRTEELVLRMEPTESLNATSREREFQVIGALEGLIPVPPIRWLDADGDYFSQPTLVYGLARGTPKPSREAAKVAGIGMGFPPDLQRKLAPQFVDLLADIHNAPVDPSALPNYDRPPVGTTDSARWQVNRVLRVWEEDRGEDFPLVEVAANWLERNLPELDCVSLVHGDYRSGNFLFDEDSGEITAILDWERSFLGDRHRDLAWTSAATFGSRASDGTLLVGGLIPLDEFFARYRERSGLSIDPDKLRWWRVFNSWQAIVTALGSSYRAVKLGKTHQDILLTWLDGAAYAMADDLAASLAEVI